MIPIVRTFGAPVIDPLGKSARKTSGTPVPGSSSAVTVDVSCHTVSKRSGSNTLAHRTVPGRAMRPRSLRSRSTIIAFSARSFTEAVSRSRCGVVLREPATARRGALHRSRGQPVAVQPEEQLRRGGQDAVAARRSGTRRVRRAARSRGRGRARARRPRRSSAAGACGSPGTCRPRRCARGSPRSPGRSGRGRRSAPTRRTAGTSSRGEGSTVSCRCWNIANQASGSRENGSSGGRGRTTSDGSSPGAASYVTNPATHRPRAAAPSAAASVGSDVLRPHRLEDARRDR